MDRGDDEACDKLNTEALGSHTLHINKAAENVWIEDRGMSYETTIKVETLGLAGVWWRLSQVQCL
jgi:hypothetical protein